MTCNRITQPQAFFAYQGVCGQAQKPQVNNTSVFNNVYNNQFKYTSYNRQTNINQTFINNDNAQVSINNNITVNNYNQFGKKQSIQPGFKQRVGQFFGGYKTQPQVGCGCKQQTPRIGWGQRYIQQPIQRFCSGITNTLRSFLNQRYSNV